MKINLNDQQYRQFVDFAAAVDKDDFAKLGAGSHVVKKTEFDFYGNSRRGAPSREINDNVRALFKSTILRMFNVTSEEHLPESLRNAMKLHDYGEGRPLSARRIRAVDREIKALAAVNFSGKMSKLVSETLLKGCGIPKSQDPAQELKRRMNAIAKAKVQTSTAKQIGVDLRTDGHGNKLDHFDFGKDRTAFNKDYKRAVNVHINGGPSLAGLEPEAARDEIVKFLTGDDNATYAAADDQTKIKAQVLMANANQSVAASFMSGVGYSFDPKGKTSRLSGTTAAKQNFDFNFTKDAQGNIVIKCDLKATPAQFMVTDENGRSEMKSSDVGGYCKYHMDVTIRPENLDRFARARWETFSYEPVERAERDDNLAHHLEVAARKLKGDFKLDVDVDVSYEMHADKFFNLGEPIVAPGKRADYNADITSNLHAFKFDKVPQNILDALDEMKDAVNARCGADTVETREALLILVGTSGVKNALDTIAIGLPRSLDGNDVRKAIRDVIKTSNCIEKAKVLECMKALADGKGIADATLNKGSANRVLQSVAGLKGDLEECRTPEDFAAVLKRYEPAIEKFLRISAKTQSCCKEAFDMLVREYVKETKLPAEKVRPLLSEVRFKMQVVGGLVEKIEGGEIKVESDADVEKAFADAVKKYVADRRKLSEEADRLVNLPEWAREHLRLAALTAQSISEFRLAEYAPLASQLDLGPLKTALCGEPFAVKDAVTQLAGVCRKVMAIAEAHVGREAFKSFGTDAVNMFASILFKCAVANDPELMAALADKDKSDAITAAVFAIKKPADLGENADIIVFNSLKQLNGQILNSAAELLDDMPKQ